TEGTGQVQESASAFPMAGQMLSFRWKTGPRCEQGLVTIAHTGAQGQNHQGTALDPLKVEMRKGGRAILAQSSGTQPRQGLRRSPCLCGAKGYCWGFELVPEEERLSRGPQRPEGDGTILPIWTRVATGRGPRWGWDIQAMST
ncbi:mCG146317, partial [Mus musculus]